MRILVLVDGEHHPPVVRAAIDHVPHRVPGATVVGAALVGGTEKLGDGHLADLSVPVVSGATPEEALGAGLARFSPELVYDLSDEPVLDARTRMRLVARALAAGASYEGADFRFDPPPRPVLATKPSLAVIGTGKRAGKTAVTAHLARLLRTRGTAPVVVAMGRGGPAEPELVDPSRFDLSPEGLVALADSGRHAASDHIEDAVMAGVVTIGTRRCGGGMAGAPAVDAFGAGVALANRRPEALLLLEGSGQCIPPLHADATVLVLDATAEPELVFGYLGAYRVLLSDLIVVTMGPTSLADSGARTSFEGDVRRLAQGVSTEATSGKEPSIVLVSLRPTPLAPISGRRVFYATTAPATAREHLAAHLEDEHGGKVIGSSHHLANRSLLAADLEAAADAEVLVVELKAAAVDLVARFALERGMEVVFCDNRVVASSGDGSFDELGLATADLAIGRFSP
ncbi:MAG: 2,3-diphosphoglycerate synthetase [Actinomycetota bacterium]|nr:2,3-diphosphoglycerate synthetase [Actinomycetota bacterium]